VLGCTQLLPPCFNAQVYWFIMKFLSTFTSSDAFKNLNDTVEPEWVRIRVKQHPDVKSQGKVFFCIIPVWRTLAMYNAEQRGGGMLNWGRDKMSILVEAGGQVTTAGKFLRENFSRELKLQGVPVMYFESITPSIC